jgi:cysteine-S-conjugate beta-lyase
MSKNTQNKKLKTQITNLGRDPHAHDGIVNPPVFHASTILFPTYQAYLDGRAGKYPLPTYGRYGTRSTKAFEKTLATLAGGHDALLTGSGMAAIAVSLLAFLKSGDHLLMVDNCYDPNRKFCEQELKRFGIEVTYYDPLSDISSLFQPNTRVVFMESPGSLTFEVQDIRAFTKLAHDHNAIAILDNTYFAPAMNKPFEWGVDAVLYSGSKYLSGHSDLVMGVVIGTQDAMPHLRRALNNLGCPPGPDDVYLAQRGLRTLSARWPAHEKAAIEIATFLQDMPEVTQILHPAFPSCPGYDVWQRDMQTSNGLFSIVLKPQSEVAMAAFFDGLELFGMGYSWGGYESLAIPCPMVSIRDHPRFAKDARIIRLHIGLEDVEDLKADLSAAFERLRVA